MALWTPALTTTDLWLDAADPATITLVSGKSSQWDDKSGNARHATQGTDAARPTLKSAHQNGLDVLGFTTANAMVLPNIPQESGQNIFFAGDAGALGTGDRVFLDRASGTTNNLAAYFGRTNRNYRPDLYWNNAATANWPSSVNRKALWRFHYKTGTPAFTLMQVDGGTPVTTNITASALTSWNSINNTAAQQSAFDAYELIITPDIDEATADAVFGYLAHRWGLTSLLGAGHLYKTSAPFLVSGAVRDKAGALAAGRTVQAIRESDRACVAVTETGGDGGFELFLPEGVSHTLIFDGEADRNALIYRGVMTE